MPARVLQRNTFFLQPPVPRTAIRPVEYLGMKKSSSLRLRSSFARALRTLVITCLVFGIALSAAALDPGSSFVVHSAADENPGYSDLRALAFCDTAAGPRVRVFWSAVLGATSYTLHRNDSPSLEWTSVATDLPATEGSYLDTVFMATSSSASSSVVIYSYELSVRDIGGGESHSQIVSVRLPVCSDPVEITPEETPSAPPAVEPPPSEPTEPALPPAEEPTPPPESEPAPAPEPTPEPPPADTEQGLSFPEKKWGAYVGWREDAMDLFESKIDAVADMRAVFVHWGNERHFPMYLADKIRAEGKTLVIFWEATDYNADPVLQPAFNYERVLRGDWDQYFALFASEARIYGDPVILVPFSEMNGNWTSWGGTVNGNSPEKHIAAYQRIRGFFRDVPNVFFGWSPNSNSVPDTAANQMELYYPGDAYVDYVGVDGFNFGTPWVTFPQIFSGVLERLKAYRKPIYIFSFASAGGERKAAWISEALGVEIPKYPEIKGWIWFHENKEHDWRVWSDDASLKAFQNGLP